MRFIKRFFFIFPGLFVLCSMGVVYVQTQRLTPLMDYSYQVENAFRIFQNEMIYRDFFLVLTPGTYMIMALVMNMTGGYSHYAQVVLVMLFQALMIVGTYAVLRLIVGRAWYVLFLILPLLFGG